MRDGPRRPLPRRRLDDFASPDDSVAPGPSTTRQLVVDNRVTNGPTAMREARPARVLTVDGLRSGGQLPAGAVLSFQRPSSLTSGIVER